MLLPLFGEGCVAGMHGVNMLPGVRNSFQFSVRITAPQLHLGGRGPFPDQRTTIADIITALMSMGGICGERSVEDVRGAAGLFCRRSFIRILHSEVNDRDCDFWGVVVMWGRDPVRS